MFEYSRPFDSNEHPYRAPAGWQLDVLLALVAPAVNLTAEIRNVSDPCSKQYRQFQTVAALRDHFGAPVTTQRRVVSFLSSFGADAHVDPTGSFVEAKMTTAQASRIFGVAMLGDTFEDGSIYAAPERVPALPRPLDGFVSLVSGLDATIAFHARAPLTPPRSGVVTPQRPPVLGGAPKGCADAVKIRALTPNELATAYNIAPLQRRGVQGRGITVAVAERTAPDASSLAAYARCFGLGVPHVDTFDLGRSDDQISSSLNGRYAGESAGDIEIIDAIAPRVSRIVALVAHDENFYIGLSEQLAGVLDPKLDAQGMPAALSIRFGGCEEAERSRPYDVLLVERMLVLDALAGVSVVVASGDTGSVPCGEPNPRRPKPSVAFPASSEFVTAVGGTRLALSGENTIEREQVWNSSPYGSFLAGGGGVSSVFKKPWYQGPLPAGGRAMPDVSFSAVPGYVVDCGKCGDARTWRSFTGTSAAAPLFAAALALVDQESAHRLGFVNPTLYDLAKTEPTVFHDVVLGDNDLAHIGCCDAGIGYDTASGLGSADIAALARAVERT